MSLVAIYGLVVGDLSSRVEQVLECVLHHYDDIFFLHQWLSFLIGKTNSKMIVRLVSFDCHRVI